MPKVGDRVQVWDEGGKSLIGWGIITQIAVREKDGQKVPFIQLENGEKIWGDKCSWISEKDAVEAGVRIFRAVEKVKE